MAARRRSLPRVRVELSPHFDPKTPRGLFNFFEALELEAIFVRVRRYGMDGASVWFLFGINPERFVEPSAADAGACAGELEGGESTSGARNPAARRGRSTGDEATEVRGAAWRSARIG